MNAEKCPGEKCPLVKYTWKILHIISDLKESYDMEHLRDTSSETVKNMFTFV